VLNFKEAPLRQNIYFFTYLFSNKAGPPGREVISLQKEDSLPLFANVKEAKKLSARWHH